MFCSLLTAKNFGVKPGNFILYFLLNIGTAIAVWTPVSLFLVTIILYVGSNATPKTSMKSMS